MEAPPPQQQEEGREGDNHRTDLATTTTLTTTRTTATSEATITIVMTKVEKMSLLRAVISQANFRHSKKYNRFQRESWYGHHYPFGRLMFLMALASVLAVIVSVMVFPLRSKDLRALREFNTDCLLEICDVVVPALPDCVVDQIGLSATLDLEGYEGPTEVPLPESCQASLKLIMGGDDTNSDDSTMDNWLKFESLLHVAASDKSIVQDQQQEQLEQQQQQQQQEEETSTLETVKAFATITPQCQLYLYFDQERKYSLVKSDDLTNNPGQIVRPSVLETTVCNDTIPEVIKLQNVVFDSFASVNCVILCFVTTFLSLHLTIMMVQSAWQLLQLTFVLRLLLKWPKSFVGYEKITFWSVWSNMLSLCFVLNWGYSNKADQSLPTLWFQYLFFAVMVALSLFLYGDRGAARGWLDLAVLCKGLPLLEPYLDMVRDKIRLFDTLDLVGWASFVVEWLVPGENGWHRLAFLFAFWQCYPCRKQSERRFLRWLGLQSAKNHNNQEANDNEIDCDDDGDEDEDNEPLVVVDSKKNS
ncbi:hypothetical protein ACA910_010140 [Epithemia clementina (nom. ined.)]